jgi:hypothetical protein
MTTRRTRDALLMAALRHMRFLREIEERAEAAKASGDDAALARLRGRVEPILPKLMKAAKALDTFGAIFGAEVDRTLMIMPPRATRTPDIDNMADAMFFQALRHAVEAASGVVASRASSGTGGERGALTKRATADDEWRQEAERLATVIVKGRAKHLQPLSDIDLARKIRHRWAAEKGDECPRTERSLTRMISKMREKKLLDT